MKKKIFWTYLFAILWNKVNIKPTLVKNELVEEAAGLPSTKTQAGEISLEEGGLKLPIRRYIFPSLSQAHATSEPHEI